MKTPLIPSILLMSLIILYGCTQPGAKQPEQAGDKVYPVKVRQISKETITRTLDYTASLTAFEEVHFAPASPGRIDKIFVDIGDRVSKGQVLAQMDKTQLHQARVQLRNARSNFMRLDTLYDLGSISEQQYEQAKTQYEVTRSNVKFLEENTTLESPIDGIVTGRYYESGEMYSGAPNTPGGKPAVVTLMQIDPLKAYINISERYFPRIKNGMKAIVQLDMYREDIFPGKIFRLHPTVDETTRTFKAEVVVNNQGEKLRPGMFARVSLQLKDETAIVVPAETVLQQAGTNNRYIFVNNKNTAKKIDVSLGKRFDDRIEVSAGESLEGLALIVAGHTNLENGSKLEVVEDKSNSAY